jgi:hypothetical protein
LTHQDGISDIYGALNHYANGEITASLQKLERVLQEKNGSKYLKFALPILNIIKKP